MDTTWVSSFDDQSLNAKDHRLLANSMSPKGTIDNSMVGTVLPRCGRGSRLSQCTDHWCSPSHIQPNLPSHLMPSQCRRARTAWPCSLPPYNCSTLLHLLPFPSTWPSQSSRNRATLPPPSSCCHCNPFAASFLLASSSSLVNLLLSTTPGLALLPHHRPDRPS